MPVSRLLVLAITGLAMATPAAADHWRQTADPQVVQALNELAWVYGGYCQQGMPAGCQALQAVQQDGTMMLNAGYDCRVMGNAQACGYYQQAYGVLAQSHAQVAQMLQQGAMQQPMAPAGGVNPLGATHAERMGTIAQWGQERLQWGANQSARMDANHQRFMEMIRQ